MANKSQKPVVRPPFGAPAAPTKEQQEAAALRSFLQHREALTQGILYNALHGGAGTRIDKDGNPDFKPAVKAAIEAADYMFNELYGQQFVRVEQPAKPEAEAPAAEK